MTHGVPTVKDWLQVRVFTQADRDYEVDDVTIRKVNFSIFPELSPSFPYVIDNRLTQRRCQTCGKRVAVMYMQTAGVEGPQFANSPRLPAWCWPCAAQAQIVMHRLVGDEA